MKTFLGFVSGILIGALGFAMLLIVTPGTDQLINDAKDFCGVD